MRYEFRFLLIYEANTFQAIVAALEPAPKKRSKCVLL